jgi:transcriptional regulator with GAF, ATPase, and Fis domain
MTHVSEDRTGLAEGMASPSLVCCSRLFRQVLAAADAVAGNDCIVLLEGESGTGKELLARRIHMRSIRQAGPFIPLNCAGISDTLFESQFFGHVKGAFTGAITETLGIVRASEGGTLLLDEVGEIPSHLQPKLLRLLQEREVTPVGASRPVHVDTRFIASTNRNLMQMVKAGEFRGDLYHRLNIVRIELPPLRSRIEDIDPLVDYYIQWFAREYRRPPMVLAEQSRQHLREYSWPGNVRELCAYVERLYATESVPLPPGLSTSLWDDGYGYGGSGLQPAAAPLEAALGRITCTRWPTSSARPSAGRWSIPTGTAAWPPGCWTFTAAR